MKLKCPMTFNILFSEETEKKGNFDCIEGQCAWWVGVANTERRTEYGCAIALLAMKNQEGRIQL